MRQLMYTFLSIRLLIVIYISDAALSFLHKMVPGDELRYIKAEQDAIFSQMNS